MEEEEVNVADIPPYLLILGYDSEDEKQSDPMQLYTESDNDNVDATFLLPAFTVDPDEVSASPLYESLPPDLTLALLSKLCDRKIPNNKADSDFTGCVHWRGKRGSNNVIPPSMRYSQDTDRCVSGTLKFRYKNKCYSPRLLALVLARPNDFKHVNIQRMRPGQTCRHYDCINPWHQRVNACRRRIVKRAVAKPIGKGGVSALTSLTCNLKPMPIPLAVPLNSKTHPRHRVLSYMEKASASQTKKKQKQNLSKRQFSINAMNFI